MNIISAKHKMFWIVEIILGQVVKKGYLSNFLFTFCVYIKRGVGAQITIGFIVYCSITVVINQYILKLNY